MRILPKTRKVPCPDGSVVTVYRIPSDAFPLFLETEAKQLSAGLKIVHAASAHLGASNKAQAEQLLLKLNETNGSLQADFNSVYTAYAADPCLDRTYLRVKLDEIRRDRNNLEALFVQVRIIELALSNGAPAAEVMAAIERALQATLPVQVQETIKMIAEAPAEIEQWRRQDG